LAGTKSPGISVIICCHNSTRLLPATLTHLVCQRVDRAVNWEVLIIDNASIDDTRECAEHVWTRADVPLRVSAEERLGLAYARARGIREARHEILAFIDDDNWVCPVWVQTVFEVMRDQPQVGALGGIIEPRFETVQPAWFGPVAYLYATGPENEPSGDVTEMHMLCGAGLNVRHTALTDIRKKGFRPISVGRQGTSLGAGEDSEMTYSLRLSGWRLWIDPRLRLTHFLPERRLQWEYARKLAYGSAHATPERDALVHACKPPRHGITLRLRRLRERWFWQIAVALKAVLAASTGVLSRALGGGREGDRAVLKAEFACGRLAGLIDARRWYDARATEIRNVMMNIQGQQ